MNKERVADLVLRVGLAFAFLYPPFSALMDPGSWVGYFPRFMRGIVPDPVLLHGFGLLEAAIAVWILSGKKIFIPSVLAAVILCAIVFFDSNDFEVVFRDLSIACIAVALAVVHRPGKKMVDASS
jgi:uncharacterized membrane protein YphA (DoxX/SURF4 family)